MAQDPTRTHSSCFQFYRVGLDPAIWWRVMSPNGRALARSCEAGLDLQSARESIETVRARLDDLVPKVRVTATHRWRWQLVLDDAPWVQGWSEQDRRVRCDTAWRVFVEVARTCPVDPVLHQFHRGYDPRPLTRAVG